MISLHLKRTLNFKLIKQSCPIIAKYGAYSILKNYPILINTKPFPLLKQKSYYSKNVINRGSPLTYLNSDYSILYKRLN